MESRLVLSAVLNVAGTYAVNSYARVGFQENEVATFSASVNGQADPNASDFSAQIDWGDGSQSSGSLVFLQSNGVSAEFAIKGSHVYQQLETNLKINVTVTGQSASASAQTALADVVAMPSGIAGTKPTQYGSSSPANVSINVAGTYAVSSYTDVGFQENEVATVNVSLNGKPDTTLSDLHAQINYGDDASWSSGDLVYLNNNGVTATYEVKGTHVYANENTNLPIVVYVNGPDGTSASDETALSNVTNMPSGIPGAQPKQYGSPPPTNVSINVAGTYAVSSYTDVGFQENEVAIVNVSLNGKPDTTPSDLHAQINYGDDDSWSIGDLVYLNNNGVTATYEVTGTHVYAKANTNVPIVVYVNGPDGTSASDQTALANITDMPSGIPGTQPTQYGSPPPADVAINVAGSYSVDSYAGVAFTNKQVATVNISVSGKPDDTLGDLHAQINFGDDASWASGTLVFQSDNGVTSSYEIEGSHVYKKTGTNIPIVVYVNGPDGTSASGQTALANISPNPNTMSATATAITATEGDDFKGAVATFTDTNTSATESDFTATITWPDATTSDGDISASGDGFEVSGDHTFDEEGTQPFTVAISGKDGTSATVLGAAIVADAALDATFTPISATEGSTFGGTVATFTDEDPKGTVGDYAATVFWGDNTTTPGTVATAAGGFAVRGSHAYVEEGNPALRVVVTDVGGSTATASGTASVQDASLSAAGQAVAATEGTTFTGTVATFSDADPNGMTSDYSATIVWGDSATTTGTITTAAGGFAVVGVHAYSEEGSATFTVAVKDIGGSTATASGIANIADAPLTPAGVTFGAVAGTTFDGKVATFADANAAATTADFTATIDWGDGSPTSAGAVTAAAGGGFFVTGSHLYSSGATSRQVAVLVDDKGAASATATSTAAFADVVASFAPLRISPTVGTSFSGAVATFNGTSANGTSADFSAAIVWGDGATTAPAPISGTAAAGYTVGVGKLSGARRAGRKASRPASRPRRSSML